MLVYRQFAPKSFDLCTSAWPVWTDHTFYASQIYCESCDAVDQALTWSSVLASITSVSGCTLTQ